MAQNQSVVDIKPVNQTVTDIKPVNQSMSDVMTIYIETRNISVGQWIPFVGFTYPTALTFTATRL